MSNRRQPRGRALRALAFALLASGMLAAVLLGATHHHLDARGSCVASCVHCGGGATPQQLAWIAEAPSLAPDVRDAQAPLAPVARFALRLDHSGCAPPTL